MIIPDTALCITMYFIVKFVFILGLRYVIIVSKFNYSWWANMALSESVRVYLRHTFGIDREDIAAADELADAVDAAALSVSDESVEVDPAVSSMDFAGNGVTVTQSSEGAVTVTIPGGGAGLDYIVDGPAESIIEGNVADNEAAGQYAHAEGDDTSAPGLAAHAEGQETNAGGIAAHAEGFQCSASGPYSHAEGYQNESQGDHSHAEGRQNLASGNNSHVEGFDCEASGNQSSAGGNGSTSSGENSFAHGQVALASGLNSAALGRNNISSSDQAFSAGYGNNVSGINSAAVNESNIVSGNDSFASGFTNTASGLASRATGMNSTASGQASSVEGEGCVASGNNSHAEGALCQALSESSHAEGSSTTAANVQAHAEGWVTYAGGPQAHAEGQATLAATEASHAEGYQTYALADHSHSEGSRNVASGSGPGEGEGGAHAEGRETSVGSKTGHAEGYASASGSRPYDCQLSGTTVTIAGVDLTAIFTLDSRVVFYALTGGSNNTLLTQTELVSNPQFSGGDTTFDIGSPLDDRTSGKVIPLSGLSAHAEGIKGFARGTGSHAEGMDTESGQEPYNGEKHEAEVTGTSVVLNTGDVTAQFTAGYALFVEMNPVETVDQSTVAVRKISNLAFGMGTTFDIDEAIFLGASGSCLVIPLVVGDASHAEGARTQAKGFAAHAEGANTKAVGDMSSAGGLHSLARLFGEHARSGGKMGTGFSQTRRVALQSAAGTADQNLQLGPTADPKGELEIVDDINSHTKLAWAMKIKALAYDDAAGEMAMFDFTALVKQDSGVTIAYAGSPQAPVQSMGGNASSWTLDITNPAADTVRLVGSDGLTGSLIRWSAEVEIIEITLP